MNDIDFTLNVEGKEVLVYKGNKYKAEDYWFTPELDDEWKMMADTMAEELVKEIPEGKYIVAIDPAYGDGYVTSIVIDARNTVHTATINHEPIYILPTGHVINKSTSYFIVRFNNSHTYYYAGVDDKGCRVWSKQHDDGMPFDSVGDADLYAHLNFPPEIYKQCTVSF